MTHLEFFGGWYVDALPTGERAVLFPLTKQVATHQGKLSLLDNDYPLFLVITNVGTFKVAGKGHDSKTTWEWFDGAWAPRGEAVGNFSVIYDQAGQLHISKGGAVGSQGWRYVAPNGDLITGDATYGSTFGLSEWTDLSPAQDRSLVVGQGNPGGGVQVKDGAVIRRLFPLTSKDSTECYAIHAHRVGDDVCLSFYEVAPDGLTAHIVHATVAELRALPLASTPVEDPVRSERFWYQPNIASRDMLQLFDDPANLAGIDVFSLPIQNNIFDGANQGPDTWQALQANHVYKKLKQAGIPFAVEMGLIKEGDCQIVNALKNLTWVVEHVREQGGDVGCVSWDEPLTGNAGCHLTIDQIADAAAEFTKAARALNVRVGLLEAWPNISLDAQQTFLIKLKDRGVLPAYWHADIDEHRAVKEKKSISNFVINAQRIATELGITFGVFIVGYDHATDAEYFAESAGFARDYWAMLPNVAHVHVAAWAFRLPKPPGIQDIPNNLGPNGLLASYRQTKALFAGELPPPPPPPPEGHPMFLSILTDPIKEVLAIKAIKPIAGSPLATLIFPNDRPCSIQPDGSVEDRDPGTEGGYEKCRVAGNVATWHFDAWLNPDGSVRAPARYISKAFVLVDGL